MWLSWMADIVPKEATHQQRGAAVLRNHIPGACDALFLDGRCAFLRYPGDPPVTQGMANIMALFDAN